MGAMTERITQADIVGVALGLLATGGLHALGMRRIADGLGVQQSALYWHFDNKQQLLAAVADEIVAPVVSVAVSSRAHWETRTEALASLLRSEVSRYPDGAELVATTIAFRLGAQQPARQFAAELTAAGLTPQDAGIGASVLLHFVLGYATDEQQHHQATALGAIEHAGDDHDEMSADERFVSGIRLIIEGVDVRLRATRQEPA